MAVRRPFRGRRLAMAFEAAVLLMLARLALRFLPFRTLAAWVSRPPAGPEAVGAERQRVRLEVHQAIRLAWKRLPMASTCFHRALAAQAMLRRRQVGATLWYGASRLPVRGLRGHVWLQDGEHFIVGQDASRDCTPLASFPGA